MDFLLKEHREYKLIDYYIDDGYSGTNFDRLELENKVKCIYIDKNKNVKIDIK